MAVSAQRVSAGIAISVWVTISRRRFGEAVGEHAAPGAEEEDRQELQRRGDADGDAAAGELRISHISATICIQLPLSETIWPAK